ncbi:MAG: hypothetical protein RLZZ56_500 [Actinomycetota bacterium]|jgi:hypothetical protein
MDKKIFVASALLVVVAITGWFYFYGNQIMPVGNISQNEMKETVRKLFQADQELWHHSREVSLAIANDPNSKLTKQFKYKLGEIYISKEADRIFKVSVDLLKSEGAFTLDYTVDDLTFVIRRWDGAVEKDGVVTAKFLAWTDVTEKGSTNHNCETEWTVVLKKDSAIGPYLIADRSGKDLNPTCRS